MPTPIIGLSLAALASALVLGGSSRRGLQSDLLPQILGLLLLALVADRAVQLYRKDRFAFFILAALPLVPLLHLLPMPPGVWSLLPGRVGVLSTFRFVGGEPPWLPLSLQPGETWRALFALLPGLGLYLAVRNASSHQRLVIIISLIGIGLVSVPVSMLQLLGGAEEFSLLAANIGGGRPAGFFANPNHFVTLLVVLCPLVGALCAVRIGGASVQPWVLGACALVMLMLGLSLSGSRSSLALGLLAIVGVWLAFVRPLIEEISQKRYAFAAVAVSLLIILPVAMGMGLSGIVERAQQQDVAEDARWLIASATWNAIWSYFPFGSGVGTFQAIYQLHEPAAALMFEVVNNAHNDALEAVMEAGLVGLMLLGAWLLFLSRATIRAFQREGGRDARIAKAAAVGLWLMTLHSLWDYPLRTIALIATAGVLAAVLRPPQDADRPLAHASGRKDAATDVRRKGSFRRNSGW